MQHHHALDFYESLLPCSTITSRNGLEPTRCEQNCCRRFRGFYVDPGCVVASFGVPDNYDTLATNKAVRLGRCHERIAEPIVGYSDDSAHLIPAACFAAPLSTVSA